MDMDQIKNVLANSITHLNLNGYCIDAEGMRFLAEALKINTTLTNIDLMSNKIGADGMIFLAEALKINTTLTTIDLSCDSIDVEGIRILADALTINTSIIRVDNDMSNPDIKKIINNNKQLRKKTIDRSKKLLEIKQYMMNNYINYPYCDNSFILNFTFDEITTFILLKPFKF